MFDPLAQSALMPSFSHPEPINAPVKQAMKGELRRSASAKDNLANRKVNRASASSPVKSSGRPGLSRSVSESRGRKAVGRASTLPTLAPAIRPAPQPNLANPPPQIPRSGGRTSPLKNNHNRPSSLTSIPESAAPRVRTSVKFTIDARGRARAETTTVVEDDDDEGHYPTVIRSRKEARGRSRTKQDNSSEDDESSTDDEPIIIPSRNSSFALPEARNPSFVQSFASQHNASDEGPGSLGIYYNEQNSAHNDPESEAETVMNWQEAGQGDAMSELRKVVKNRQKTMTLNTSQRFVSGPPYSGSTSTISPASLTDSSSLPTPSAERRTQLRCVCNSNGRPHGNSYLVKWYVTIYLKYVYQMLPILVDHSDYTHSTPPLPDAYFLCSALAD